MVSAEFISGYRKREVIKMPENRKNRTEQFLRESGIPINPYLPTIASEDEATIRTPEEIMKRALCAFFTAQVGCEAGEGRDIAEAAQFFLNYIKAYGLENELTDDEKRFLYYDGTYSLDMGTIVAITWRLEMCMPLFWACGFLEGDLAYPCCANDMSFVVSIIKECGSFAQIMDRVKMKTKAEILDNADAIFRMDWACVDARIKGMPAPAELDPEVVVEQHKGFNWLIDAYGSDDWDNVPADT